MEKNDIIVGKHCMELSRAIISLVNSYNLITTDLAVNDSVCVYPNYIKLVKLSAEEIMQFSSFYHSNQSLQKIGFSESSLLFLAKSRHIKVAVTDKITLEICNELGIKTIKIEHEKTAMHSQTILNTNKRTSRLSAFRITACL